MDIKKYYDAVKTAKNCLYELENNFTNDNGHIDVNQESFTIAKKAKVAVETMESFKNYNIDMNEHQEIINWNNMFQFSFRKLYKTESK